MKLLVLGLLGGAHAQIDCDSSISCPSGQFCNFDDVTSGFCENCGSSGGSDGAAMSGCYFYGILHVEGADDCAAKCPSRARGDPGAYQPYCTGICQDTHCNEIYAPKGECGSCGANSNLTGLTYTCKPGAPGFDEWVAGPYECGGGASHDCREDEGGPPTFIFVVPAVFIAGIVIAIRKQRAAIAKRQQREQAGPGRAAVPAAQSVMPVPVPQAMAPLPSLATTTMQIVVPPTAFPGQTIQVNANGQMMSVVVPSGAAPGGTMMIQVPAPIQAVQAMPVVAAAAAVPMAVVPAQQQQAVDEGGILMGMKLS